MATIDQGGNAFGTTMIVGTTDANDIRIIMNGSPITTVTSSGLAMAAGKGMINGSNTNNSSVVPLSTGTLISRNINDGEFGLTVNYDQGTGGILRGQFNGVDKFKIPPNGQIRINTTSVCQIQTIFSMSIQVQILVIQL